MKLYYAPGACSLSPHIVLRESGIAFEAIKVSTKTHQFGDGNDYYTINPLGYVPVLELDDGTRLREGPAIVQYIADQAPLKNLAPANGTLARYRVQEWLSFISTEIHKGFSPLFNSATPEEYKNTLRTKLRGRFEWVDGQLEGRDYLGGEHFGVADAYLFATSGWAKNTGVDLTGLHNLLAWRERVAARPAVQEALQAEKA